MASKPQQPTPTAAPPPTPSGHHPNPVPVATTDFLSHLLHRLHPPTLSLPSRRSAVVTPPLISLSDHISPADLAFFHLAIDGSLLSTAESAADSLFSLPDDRKQLLFPADWPLGYDGESFCLHPSSSVDGALREFALEMEKLGLEVLDRAGFEGPAREGLSSQLWMSNGATKPGRVYPDAVGLHYQVRGHKQSLLTDSGWVTVSGRADSVLVTMGDIAQVWSNGKLKKVRGRPIPCINEDAGNNDDNLRCITLSLLITLPHGSTLFPLVPEVAYNEDGEPVVMKMFTSFLFDDYAWRVYHKPLLLKDALDRYRI